MENNISEIAKSATEKYFDLHREQLNQLNMEGFVRAFTRTYNTALKTVENEMKLIQENEKARESFSSQLR